MSPKQLQALLQLLDLVAIGLVTAPEVLARYRTNRAKLESAITEGRDPTPEEMDELLGAVQASIDEFLS